MNGQKPLEENIMELQVYKNINLLMNNNDCLYKPHIYLCNFLNKKL